MGCEISLLAPSSRAPSRVAPNTAQPPNAAESPQLFVRAAESPKSATSPSPEGGEPGTDRDVRNTYQPLRNSSSSSSFVSDETIVEHIGPGRVLTADIAAIQSRPKTTARALARINSEPRPSTRRSSIGTLMENRPGSGTSYTQIYRNHMLPRTFTIDTSRARSNEPVVSLCSKRIGIHEYPNGRDDGKPCDIYWHSLVYSDMRNIVKSAHSRVSKFPGMTDLAKKISLTHAISSMQRLFPDEYNFYPKSWFIPAHLKEFHEYYQKEMDWRRKYQYKCDDLWFIVKPDEGCQGTGIYLINHPSQIKNIENNQLVQEYVADPLLMQDQLKFDFRVYGVIKSINPLSIYVAREGMARFCTEKYEKPTNGTMDRLFAHLTNYSLNKENGSYVHSNTLKDQARGSKRLLSTVFHQLESRGVKTKRLWHEIKMIIIKTVLAMLPEIMLHYEHHFYGTNGPQCFQIIGFDIMVKADGKPVLLEVNSSASLSIDHTIYDAGKTKSIVDEIIKVPLVRDTLLLVLDLLEEEYAFPSTPTSESNSEDASSVKSRRKPHLSEIFPGRYGSNSGHLLFLDKAMYIFMQFVQLRNTVNISSSGLKQFLRKCNLTNIVHIDDVEKWLSRIHYHFTGERSNSQYLGLPFHAFLMFLYHVAEEKFPQVSDLLSKMQLLMSYCDMSLRHYGVRSARLRRAEVDSKNNDSAIEIYMLPSRMRAANHRSKSSEPPMKDRKVRKLDVSTARRPEVWMP